MPLLVTRQFSLGLIRSYPPALCFPNAQKRTAPSKQPPTLEIGKECSCCDVSQSEVRQQPTAASRRRGFPSLARRRLIRSGGSQKVRMKEKKHSPPYFLFTLPPPPPPSYSSSHSRSIHSQCNPSSNEAAHSSPRPPRPPRRIVPKTAPNPRRIMMQPPRPTRFS